MIDQTSNNSATTPESLADGVALIHPPAVSKRYLQTKFMPYGMAVLYAFLRDNSVPVRQFDFLMEYLFDSPDDVNYHDPRLTFSEQALFGMLDGKSTHKGLEDFVDKYVARIPGDARIYAFSIVAYHQFWASLLLADRLREVNPSATIVFGGPFITIKPKESFVPYGKADYWIKGNGEGPLLTLCEMTGAAEGVREAKIPGLIYYDNGRVVENPKSQTKAQDEPAPDFEGLDLSQYRYDLSVTGGQTLFIPYRISKGCPSQCSFCTGRLVDAYDVKSADKVVSELLSLSRKYGSSNFMFADASVNGSPKRLSKICDKLIQEFPSIRWYAYSRIRGFDEDLLRKVKQAGCFSLFWGVESAHQPTIELLGKRFQVDRMYDLLDASISIGIKNYVHLVYNTPHESPEDVASLIRLVDRYIDIDLVVFLPQRFLLEPQSLMFEFPEKYGLENVVKTPKGLLEREEFVYDEKNGLPSEGAIRRNETHRKLLADHLELIHYRNLRSAAHDWIGRRLPPKLLVWTGKLAKRSAIASTAHNKLVRRLQSGKSGFSEKM